eukprot:jgi/Chrzof1/9645/Cz04g10240.t1
MAQEASQTKGVDHLGFEVASYDTSKKFYEESLGKLGYAVMVEIPANKVGKKVCGMGRKIPDFWFSQAESSDRATTGLHVAIQADNRAAVDAFYEAAMRAGMEHASTTYCGSCYILVDACLCPA